VLHVCGGCRFCSVRSAGGGGVRPESPLQTGRTAHTAHCVTQPGADGETAFLLATPLHLNSCQCCGSPAATHIDIDCVALWQVHQSELSHHSLATCTTSNLFELHFGTTGAFSRHGFGVSARGCKHPSGWAVKPPASGMMEGDFIQNSVEPWLPVGYREEDDEDFHLDEGEEDLLGSEDSEEGEEEEATPCPQNAADNLQGAWASCNHMRAGKACVLARFLGRRATDAGGRFIQLDALVGLAFTLKGSAMRPCGALRELAGSLTLFHPTARRCPPRPARF
jgi:hypothetical protein